MQISSRIVRGRATPETVSEVNLTSGNADASNCTQETASAIMNMLMNKHLRGPVYRATKKGRCVVIKPGLVGLKVLLDEGFTGKPIDNYDFSETQFAAKFERLKRENAAYALWFRDEGTRPLKKGQEGTVMIQFVSKPRTVALVMTAAEARELHAQLGRALAGKVPRDGRPIVWSP